MHPVFLICLFSVVLFTIIIIIIIIIPSLIFNIKSYSLSNNHPYGDILNEKRLIQKETQVSGVSKSQDTGLGNMINYISFLKVITRMCLMNFPKHET